MRLLAAHPHLCTPACEFYRAEPGFLLQVLTHVPACLHALLCGAHTATCRCPLTRPVLSSLLNLPPLPWLAIAHTARDPLHHKLTLRVPPFLSRALRVPPFLSRALRVPSFSSRALRVPPLLSGLCVCLPVSWACAKACFRRRAACTICLHVGMRPLLPFSTRHLPSLPYSTSLHSAAHLLLLLLLVTLLLLLLVALLLLLLVALCCCCQRSRGLCCFCQRSRGCPSDHGPVTGHGCCRCCCCWSRERQQKQHWAGLSQCRAVTMQGCQTTGPCVLLWGKGFAVPGHGPPGFTFPHNSTHGPVVWQPCIVTALHCDGPAQCCFCCRSRLCCRSDIGVSQRWSLEGSGS